MPDVEQVASWDFNSMSSSASAIASSASTGAGREPELVGAQVDQELHAVVDAGEELEQAFGRRNERVTQGALGRAPGRVADRRVAHAIA